MKTVLTIAGSDCSGGAGIQADLKTMCAYGVYGMSVITALTAQNTLGVTAIADMPPQFVMAQMDAVFSDIPPDAVKIGMVSTPDIIRAVANRLREWETTNLVVDPVMVATSGSKLLTDQAIETLVEQLLPLALVITPNRHEAALLADMAIEGPDDMIRAARTIAERCHTAVLLKGGHSPNDANDLLWTDGPRWFEGPRIDNPNTHGTGCTLSSAIACGLAKGMPLPEAIATAKAYLQQALQAGLNLGQGRGPLNHLV